jgi:cellulose biosynthesis protein BcsQ
MENYIIAIINNKGGVGKTTASCNLPQSLAKNGRKVLVIDLDSQANTTRFFMPAQSQNYLSLYDLLKDTQIPKSDSELQRYICNTPYEDVYLLPNVQRTAALEPVLYQDVAASYMSLRSNLRDYIKKNFDICLVDCPPNIGMFVMMALNLCDFVIVPIESGSNRSMDGLDLAIDTINEVSEVTNPDLRFLRLLVNKVDKRKTSTKNMLEKLSGDYGEEQLFKTTLSDSDIYKQSEAFRTTVQRINSTSTASKQIRALAKELLTILDQLSGTDRQPSLFEE